MPCVCEAKPEDEKAKPVKDDAKTNEKRKMLKKKN